MGEKIIVNDRKYYVVNDRKYYVEIDKLRLVYEDGEIVGYYNPEGPEEE